MSKKRKIKEISDFIEEVESLGWEKVLEELSLKELEIIRQDDYDFAETILKLAKVLSELDRFKEKHTY